MFQDTSVIVTAKCRHKVTASGLSLIVMICPPLFLYPTTQPGLRSLAKYTVTNAGVVQLQYEKITATVMGLEVDTPSFLAKQASSSIQTKWFNGQMWIERLKVQDVDGVPEEARAAIEAASLAAGTPGYIYNVYRFDGD